MSAQSGTRELRFATLAPEGTPWTRALHRWDREIRERTSGRVGLRLYTGGAQGQEPVVIDKMSAGQLDGAALTTTGLGQIVRPVTVLGIASVVGDYEGLDRVRRRMRGRFRRLFSRAGYSLVGWGDVGRARLFSRRRIQRPREMRSARVWAPRSDESFTTFLDVVGVQPRRLGVPEVYPALQTGMVDTLAASALAVVALQWHRRLRYVSSEHAGVLVGASVFREEALESLSEDDRRIVERAGRAIGRRAQRAVRRADEDAMRALSRRLQTVDTEPFRAEWERAGEETVRRLTGRVFSERLLAEVIRASAPEDP
ncbi:MAG: TRAP transporter substrate-binding protein DctP [Myxococcota bacterium]